MKNIFKKYIAPLALLAGMSFSSSPAEAQTVLFSDNFDPIQPGWLVNTFGAVPPVAGGRNQFFYTAPGCPAPNGTIAGNSIGILANISGSLFCGYVNTPVAFTGYAPLVFHSVSTVGYNNINVNFLFKCRGEGLSADFGRWMYSFDGVNWFTLFNLNTGSTGVFSLSATMGAAFNNTNFFLGWSYTSNSVNNIFTPPLIFDNLNVTGTPICVPPTITCSGPVSANAGASCNALVSYGTTIGGTSPAVSYSFSGATTGSGSGTGSGSTFNKGVTTVTLTATNACGTATCSFTVTVNDVTAPAISCPADVSVSCEADIPAPGGATATDNCPGVSVALSSETNNGGTACDGNPLVISRTYTATDASGNTSSCTQTITVEADPVVVDAGDNVTVYDGAPGFDCATLSVSASGGCAPYSYAWSTGSSSTSITVCPTTRTCYTVTVTDANGCSYTDEVCVCVVNVHCDARTNNGHGGSGQAGAGLGTIKIYICHTPPASGWQTKCLPVSAMLDHLSHGDFLGPCSVGPNPSCDDVPSSGKMSNPVHEMSMAAFPNPFETTASVRFVLGHDDVATVKVFNQLGAQIATLFQGEVQAGAENTVTFNGAGHAKGIYLVQITTASGKSMTERIVMQ